MAPGISAVPPTTSPLESPNANILPAKDEPSRREYARRLQPLPYRLQSTHSQDIHDVVCVGFGPASLAIAIALFDLLNPEFSAIGNEYNPKVRFIERQGKFGWHAGMLLPGAKMQISFIKDLATLRNPCSPFTFLNYLRQHNRLVQFANLGTFLPSRLEFEDYMRWASAHFDDVVEYGSEVKSIRPYKESGSDKYNYLEVESLDISTGQTNVVRTHNVVIAVGGIAVKPTVFPLQHSRVLHSSEYSLRIGQALPVKEHPYKIAIVGSGQSAAEVFNDLHSRYPNCQTKLIIRDSALRPSDDSPFVNEIFNPEAVNSFFNQPQQKKHDIIKKNKATNYSVVRLELLEKIYEHLYLQSIHEPDCDRWQHQILQSREVVQVVESPSSKQLQLLLKNLDPSINVADEIMEADAVVLATGYRRDAHYSMLKDCQHINGSGSEKWRAGRDYKLNLDPSQVADNVGIWLQGCNEETHGLSDSLLSILATRSGELVQAMFGQADPDGVASALRI